MWSEQLSVTFSSILECNITGVESIEGGYFVHILRPDFGRTRLWDGPRVKIADDRKLAGVEFAED